jgi:RimJ/RimL family protein N-acetyltransferase
MSSKRIHLRPRRLSDATTSYVWQQDPELARLDATPPITMSFPTYLSAYLEEMRHLSNSRRTFAIDTVDGKHVGNCSCYEINQRKSEAQIGIMIGDRAYWNQGYGTEALTALLDLVFQETNLKRVYLKTLLDNIRAQKCFLKCGFTACGHLARDGHQFLLMEQFRKDWEERNRKGQGEQDAEPAD